ncbi:MAG: Gfo/Idh/MocA family oxidoreductase [Thermofilaceae archaeon]|nr:Gfo/Idh/MocA family oxidoreductase [Thermofilaceae archaeon]
MLKFGLAGTGVGGEFIAKALQLLKSEGRAELVAVTGRRRGKTEEFARRYGAGRWYLSFEQMLSDPDVEAVAISTPHYLHFPQAISAIEAGKHVLVDKPLAVNLREADEMIRKAEHYGVKLGVVFEYRFDPIVEKLKTSIEQGKLGRLILGEAIVEWFRTPEYYSGSGWRGRWATEGGGALINQAIHTIDLLLWLMGDVEKIWALTGTFMHDIEVEDLAVAALKFRSGAFGVIQGSTAIYPGLPTRLEVHGTNGTAVIEGGALKVLAIRGEEEETKEGVKGLESWARPEAVPVENHLRLVKDFVTSVEEGGRPRVDGYEGRRSLEVIRAIYFSSWSGQVVTLPFREV